MNSASQQYNILKGYNMLLYFAGTMIMYDPAQECINDFWSKGILKKLPVSSQNPRFIKAASQLHQSVGDQNSTIEAMRNDFKTLFNEEKNPVAPPLESVYKNKGQINFENSTSQVGDFYNSYGWESRPKGNIPADHLGIELLFLTLMVEKYLELDDEICNSEMRNEIRRFISLHLMSWIPVWNEQVQQHAYTLSYKGIGTLVQACVEDLYDIMGQTNINFN